MAAFQLYYWPSIPGRGEFIRLAFEDAGVEYDDVGRRSQKSGGGTPALMKALSPSDGALTPFALPVLHHATRDGDVVVAHVAAILQYVAPLLGQVPKDDESRRRAHQIQLTVSDFVAEVHDTHHPIAASRYYEDQKREAKKRSFDFIEHRMPKFLTYFSRALAGNPWLLGDACSYVDLSLFQVVAGLRYAFPNAMADAEKKHPRIVAIHDAVAARPRIAAYLASKRRLAFNEDGIFRRYPELDLNSPRPRRRST